MQNNAAIFAPMLRQLERLSPLAEADREALCALPFAVRTVSPAFNIIRDGDQPEVCTALLSGFAFRHKLTGDGARQIISIHIPGEFIDLQNLFLEDSDHGVQTLTEAQIASVSRSALGDLCLERPALARAFWVQTLVDASIFREWVVNVGRRDSRARVAHLLCEFSLRLAAAGLADNHHYVLPMTQEQLADAVGLTSVHVNRVLKGLEQEGLIGRDKRSIRILDWDRMRAAGDFSERYLHHEAMPAMTS